ncbi:MAG TPA: glycoside hydrolase family 16 protein [Crocinitomicaceae bacterium]|nr:glycoside hydrolase family 16 protein [Crocinitomicaceae bacterium]
MKKVTSFIPLLFCLWTFGQTPANDPHWQLVWEDNFNSLNTTIWKVANHFDHYGGEPQVYTNRTDNVFISNGSLVLRAKKEIYNCPSGSINQWDCVRQYNTGQPYNYTSGWIETKQAYNTQYGYIESRIKLPHGYGFWPAFWTFAGAGITATNAAEIDIFEMLGSDSLSPNIMGTNIHKYYCDNCPAPSYCECSQLYQPACPWENPDILCYGQDLIPYGFDYTDWNTYAIEWTPSKIIWYVNNYPVRIFPNPGIVDPVRIILNFAIDPWIPPNQSTPFPSDMYIDYVKVYDIRKDCNTNLNVCNYNFSTHDNKVKKSITIGNGTCTNALNVGQNVFLRATESVLINGDFTVPVGAQLSIHMDENTCP